MKNVGNSWIRKKDCKITYTLLTLKICFVSKPSEKVVVEEDRKCA